MYEVFEQLLQKYGLSSYRVAKEAGVTQTALSNWKAGRNIPSMATMQKIADYFGVTLDYLTSGIEEPEKKETTLTPKDERDIEKKLIDTLAQLESGDGLMFNGDIMDERTKQLLELSLRNTLESAKITAKKFTPDKYKK